MTKYKFISWNIDSLNAALTGTSDRAALSMAVVDKIASEKPDVLAIQETKLSDDDKKVKKIYDILVEKFPEYAIVHRISTPPARKGYSGTMMLWKKVLGDPVVTFPEIDAPAPMDHEGRMITLEFPAFYVTTVYTPNAQEGLARLDLRGEWDDQYRAYLQTLDQEKPVFACGDFNVAVAEIDLSNPKGNHNTAGFSDQEREKFQALLSAGFTDSFRKIHGQIEKNFASGQSIYTWFAQRARTSKTNNSGWRIDYWLTSNRVAEKISKSEPIETGARLDHLPILLEFDL
ncbi:MULTISPECIES: exodeoxyribonuclease III [unclassified Lactococcus]|uniref:exodeoxyribonuclease III n=1 Tax=unclassified Lactococcus TaxID=2643510 RepID=UPI0011CB188A|nr:MULTISPECIES: exodeoxyribonuclease III [unclassified Lactococcus]MQW22297.1 exodeoxyribonuclease [Lactococcus sp. dk101]TXK45226.1 exodeoxyribonuclease III [Lactococcus sp. dk310]TXK50996.1 exodeoxyribonuclease III [Lactococcus sp. dk322]